MIEDITVSTRGRPKKEATPLKKGKSSWKPSSITDVVNKEPGYRYRWATKTADNMAKKQAEGWETVGLQGDKAKPVESGRIDDGKSLGSAFEKHDVALMRIPEEVALERDAYWDDENKRRVSGLTAHAKREINKEGAPSHGEITISSRTGTQVID